MLTVPPLSVITIVRNDAAGLARTARSVRQQNVALQWVVIDGASQDNSAAVAKAYQRPGDVIISEPDHGISDAFNKGLTHARGAWVLFLNAGDEFAAPTALGSLCATQVATTRRWVIGCADIVRADGRLLFRQHLTSNTTLAELLATTNAIVHPCVLASRDLWLSGGGYHPAYRVAMDYELWLRWRRAGELPAICPTVVCRFYRGGTSGDLLRNWRECRQARATHGFTLRYGGEYGLWFLAWLKQHLAPYLGAWAYRWRERWRLRW